MAKASIKMICAECGAEYYAEKTCRNRAEVADWEAWMAKQEGCCPDCYKARQAAQREAEARKCEEALGLSPLTGTEKQIAWARCIRKEAIESALARQRCQGVEHLTAQSRPLVKQAVAALPNAAKWWIDAAAPEIARMILHGIRCAQYAQMDDARRARVAAAIEDDTQRRDIAIYERARVAGRTYAEQVAADEAEAKATEAEAKAVRPPKPTSLAERMGRPGARWNGTYYGRDKQTIYLDGDKTTVPAEIKEAYEREVAAYDAALKEWEASYGQK